MARFRVRYVIGAGPDSEELVEVEAAMFASWESFIDFYSQASFNMLGTANPAGEIVLRVRSDLIADITKLS
jgi:hypothetical protein